MPIASAADAYGETALTAIAAVGSPTAIADESPSETGSTLGGSSSARNTAIAKEPQGEKLEAHAR